MKKNITLLILIGLALAKVTSAATGVDLPQGNPITPDGIKRFIEMIYQLLVWFAGMAMVATIIISGIMWLRAGDNPSRVEKAKQIFWGGIIGSVVILGAGVLLNTIDYFVRNVGNSTPGTTTPGSACTGGANDNCPRGYFCAASGRCMPIQIDI